MFSKRLALHIVAAAALWMSGPLNAAAGIPEIVHAARAGAAVTSRPIAKSEIVATTVAETPLEVIAREGDWIWILLPPDNNGTRRAGWIRAADIEGGAPIQSSGEGPNAAPPVQRRATRDDRRLKRAKANLDKAQREYVKLIDSQQSTADPQP